MEQLITRQQIHIMILSAVSPRIKGVQATNIQDSFVETFWLKCLKCRQISSVPVQIMHLTTVKIVSGGVLFLVALLGAALSKYASSLSYKIVRVCNALSGGILLALTLVHMLADSGDQLRKPGVAIAAFLTGDPAADPFPLGFAMTGLGFLTVLSVEVFLPGGTNSLVSLLGALELMFPEWSR